MRAIRLSEVMEKIGLKRGSIYDKLNPKSDHYDPTFPRPFKLGERAIAWDERAINKWLRKLSKSQR